MTTTVRVAAGALRSNGRLLLCLRTSTRAAHPSVWDLPGGHIDGDETPLDAVTRELREELGVEIERDASHLLATFGRQTVELHVFVVDRWSGDVRNAAPDEHDELRWVHPEEFDGLHLADEEYPDLLRAALDWRRKDT